MVPRTFLKNLGVSVNGKPLVSKTRTGGSIPSTPVEKCGAIPAAPARFCRSPIRPEPEMA